MHSYILSWYMVRWYMTKIKTYISGTDSSIKCKRKTLRVLYDRGVYEE